MSDQPQTQVNVQPAPPLPAGAVMITPKEMYDSILEIKLAVVGLPPRMDKAESDIATLRAQLDGVKGRVLVMSGGFGVCGVIGGFVLQALLNR